MDCEPDIDLIESPTLPRNDGGRERIAYLTFDDGPTPGITEDILDILNEQDIKATFFIIGDIALTYPWLIKRTYDEGHGIGNHTYSHVFKHIYESTDNYIAELIKTEEVLKSILGDDKQFKLTRFPGGSFGQDKKPFREAVIEAGYSYVDWNALNGDAESKEIMPEEALIQRMKETIKEQDSIVILMHDSLKRTTTVNTLAEIIEYLKSLGYKFELLPLAR